MEFWIQIKAVDVKGTWIVWDGPFDSQQKAEEAIKKYNTKGKFRIVNDPHCYWNLK